MENLLRKRVKTESDLLFKAIILVNEVFKDKYDKEGIPYLNHLYYVMDSVNTYEEKIVGLMHDIIEDTDIKFEDLMEIGFPSNIIEHIRLLTHDKKIPYSMYIDNILKSGDMVAIRVKKADMCHNMNKNRLNRLDINLRNRLIQKYTPEYEKLEDYLKERKIC